MTALKNKSVFLPHSYHSMTVASGLHATAMRDESKIAITHNNNTLTYRELSKRIHQLTAVALGKLKIQKGDNVAVVAKSCVEYIEIVSGLPEAGAAVAAINPRLTSDEIAAICDDSGARIVFADDSSIETVSNAKYSTVERIIHIGPEYESLLASSSSPDSYPVINEWDNWMIPYTSGTTGKPKGVVLSHRSRLLAFYQQALEYGCYSPEDRFLGTTPMSHGAGISFPMAALMTGGFTEILDSFDPEFLLRKLKNGSFSGVFTVPTQHHAIFELSNTILSKYRGIPLKAVISNASALPQYLKHKIVEYFGEGLLHETYGSTEGGFVTNLRPPYQLQKEQCVGTPFAHCSVKLTDNCFNEVPANEPGELWVKSPSGFTEYWNRSAETESAYREGWITVGDIAKRDEEGFLYIVDRKKDMVITGGVNVYPREIEEVLLNHPSISDVAVIGLPDAKWGERLKACVVLRSGCKIDQDSLSRFCEGKLAKYKIPKSLETLKTLPRNANGKVLKTTLRELT